MEEAGILILAGISFYAGVNYKNDNVWFAVLVFMFATLGATLILTN